MKLITDTNLKRFGTKVKEAIAEVKTTADSKVSNVKSINGVSLVGTENLSLEDIGVSSVKGEKGETGMQGASGVTAGESVLINDVVTGGETSFLSAEIGLRGIMSYDCSHKGVTTYNALQDAINSVPDTFQKGGLTIYYVLTSTGTYSKASLNSSTWSAEESAWTKGDNVDDSGALIIVNNLCGDPAEGTYYTLETAVKALQEYEKKVDKTYIKKGLVISYCISANTFETKQFQGTADNITNLSLWKDFGSGGSGGSTGTTVSIQFEQSPLYAKAGDSVVVKACIRSVSTNGATQYLNNIEKVIITDRDTSQVLETLSVNQASSDVDNYSFSFNVSTYFTTAGTKRFQFTITDDSGNIGTRNLTVTAVDVTIASAQTLNYTATTILQVGGSAKELPMYKFANNASDKGILCTTEIYLNNEWQVLGTATINDSYTHSVSINPQDTLGTKLAHGGYSLRIHGVDIASGVIGNYLYTTIMVVDSSNTTPIIAIRYYADNETATVKQYETIQIDLAVYSTEYSTKTASVLLDGEEQNSIDCIRSSTYTYTQRIQGVATDGSYTAHITFKVEDTISNSADFLVSGSLLDIEAISTQLLLDMDFSNRSNADSDKNIKYEDYTLQLKGANYSTNGFVKDTFGTTEYGSSTDTGIMSLRIAENVTGELNYAPFNNASIENTGMAIQWRMKVKNIADTDAKLISCINDSGYGFYVTGTQVVMTTDNNTTVAKSITSSIENNSLVDVAIVMEPVDQAPYSGIGVIKMYFDGELIGACSYNTGSLTPHNTPISFNGEGADLYLYNIRAWGTYYSFEQSFNNYLLKLNSTDSMITEYTYNQVMSSQSAEGLPAKNRPQASKLYSIGIPYFVLTKNAGTDNTDDQYPDYLEGLDGDKKTKRIYDVYAYFPDRPWQDFKAIEVTVSNQGTTSSQRPIKNIKMKLKGAVITLLHTADEFTGEELEKYKVCAANAAKHKVTIYEDSLPTNIITVKVDYSESGGANNGASTQLYNELQRALGNNYITPAQRFNAESYIINTSINSIPCAFCRTDKYSTDPTNPSYGYFHAKGNWNEDKGDAKVFGFEGVKGYNANCLNYGEFYELVTEKNETIDELLTRIPTSSWQFEESKNDDGTINYWTIVVLSEFCGPNHKVYRKQEDGSWKETTGTMEFINGAWSITGDVVNPVENYELLKYDALDWMQGVNSVEDMLTLDADGTPIWLQYYESRYPDDDNLNALYEAGKKVPYTLYNWLHFCQECNHDLSETDGTITLNGNSVDGTKANRLKKWQQELHNYANVYSILCYHVFTDYLAAVDQRSKNMMIGFYLDTDGTTRMYLNHLYDGDTILGSDNDCGLTVPALLDPNTDTSYYQGWNSVLFQQIKNAGDEGFWLDNTGATTITTKQVAAAMRSQTISSGLVPFSPTGLTKYWITDRLSKWPKLVSSFDGLRKYVEHSTSTSNYFYALHGLGIQRLKTYIKERFLFRDGFYKTGDLYSSTFNMRISASEDVTIKIKAAKKGFFGLAVERVDSITDSCYLNEGDEYTLKANSHILGAGNMMYVLGANRISEIDISCGTVSESGWNISEMTLLRKLVIGGENHTPVTITAGALKALNLGNMPFLEEIDIRNTEIASINALYCPRLLSIKADGSKLSALTLAETCPVKELSLPDTMTSLYFVNLPNLVYPNGGLSISNFGGIKSLTLSNCPNISSIDFLTSLMNAQAPLVTLNCAIGEQIGSSALLTYIKNTGARGTNDDTEACSGLTGIWWMEKYEEDNILEELRNYFPELDIHQQRYSLYYSDDLETDPANFTNTDNETGYHYETAYIRSGHIMKIREMSCPVSGIYNSKTQKMTLKAVSKADYNYLADGTAYDKSDTAGELKDTFMYIPTFYYKGINDYRNQRKYYLISSELDEPAPTWTEKNEWQLKELLYKQGYAIPSDKIDVGETFTNDTLSVMSTLNTYRMNVEGMKQVRYIGLNLPAYCSIFTDSANKVIQKDILSIQGTNNSPLDFSNTNYNYIYRDIPSGAKYLYFCTTSLSNCAKAIQNNEILAEDITRCLCVDSTDIEAIEPGWVKHPAECIGIYKAGCDTWNNIRSISGITKAVGAADSSTNANIPWEYDSDGNPTSVPVTTIPNSALDLWNLCLVRGKGYHATDYTTRNIITLLVTLWEGDRDSQKIYGYGVGDRRQVYCATTGYSGYNNSDSYGMTDTVGKGTGSSNWTLPKVWGLEGWWGDIGEYLTHVIWGSDGTSGRYTFKQFKQDHYIISMGRHTASYNTMCIYDYKTNAERYIIYGTWGKNIARVVHGKYCDFITSSSGGTEGTTSYTDSPYASTYQYSPTFMSIDATYANQAGGLYSIAEGMASNWAVTSGFLQNPVMGARLCYQGLFDNESDIDPRVK